MGQGDFKKDKVRDSTPFLNLNSMRLLFFPVAEYRWVVRKVNVK